MTKKLFTKFYEALDKKALIFALLFSLFIFFFERAMFRVNYREFILSYLDFGKLNTLNLFLTILLLLFGFFIFIYFSFASSWKYRIFYLIIFSLGVFHEYSYQNVFQRFSTFKDMQITLTTTPEQKINGLLAYFSLLALIPFLLYLVSLLFIKPKEPKHGWKSFGLIIICIIGFNIRYYQEFRSTNAYQFPTISFHAFYRTGIGYILSKLDNDKAPREAVKKPDLAKSPQPNNNIVLIVDESIRGDYLSLNGYSRKTTPFLDDLQKQGLIKNWGIAASASTCSIHSHDILLTGLQPDDFPDISKNIDKAPLIFQYAKAMGYRTYYLDGQMDSFWAILENDGYKYVDERIGINTFNKDGIKYYETDFEIAKKVNKIISASAGNFIFIFKKGVHLPYNLSFPAEETIWQPSYVGNTPYKLPPEERESIINSYDNGIRYNSDNFFKLLVTDYHKLPNNSVFIYTGDHGQTLGENGINYPHCGESKGEAIVPLFMIGNLGVEVDTKFKPIHANIFATMLDLMNYPEELRNRKYPISLLKAKQADSQERFFVPSNFKSGSADYGSMKKSKFD